MDTAISRGAYTVPEAARLLRVKQAAIRRWAFGYRRNGQEYGPAIATDLPAIKGMRAVTFVELVELMFVKGFIEAGVSWRVVREAAESAGRLYRTTHPFAMRRWFSDPSGIYTLLEETGSEPVLIEVRGHGQIANRETLGMYLDQLDFNIDQIAERWFPDGKHSPVVVDPKRAFGAPTISGTAVQTATIADAHERGSSLPDIAWWYDLDEYQVEAAVKFEQSLRLVA